MNPTSAVALEQLLQGHQDALRRQRASEASDPGINLIREAGRESDERLYCALLAWLLNPTGSHCQGGAFLGALTRALGLPVVEVEAASVTTEVSQEESRIDLEVAIPGKLLLHVETKVDSGEGDDQSGREARDLATRAAQLGVPATATRAVFLTRTGERAADEALLPRSWRDLAVQLRPVLAAEGIHPRVGFLTGHVLDCFEALTTGGRMSSKKLGEADRYLLGQHSEIIALQRAWEDLQKRVLGNLDDDVWRQAIRLEGVPGEWQVHRQKSGQPLFRRTDWLIGKGHEWTCIDTGNFTLRGFLSTRPEEQAWVGVWWGRLRDSLDDELPRRAKAWADRLPGGRKGVRFETDYGLWWSFRADLAGDPRALDELPRIVVREWAKLQHAFDEVAELSRRAKKAT